MIYINLFTLVNIFLLAFLLLYKKGRSLPNLLLALIILDPGINFAGNINVLSGNIFNFPYSIFFCQITGFLFAPLVYNYAEILMGNKFKPFYFMHILTALFVLLGLYYFLEFLVMSPVNQQHYLEGLLNENYPLQINVLNGLFIIMQQIYFTITAVRIFKYKKRAKKYYSSLGLQKLMYLTRFIQLVWILNVITIVLYLALPTIHVEYVWLPIVINIIFGFIIFYSFNYNALFTQKEFETFLSKTVDTNSLKNKTLSVIESPKKTNELFQKIELFVDDDLYKVLGLTIDDLSKKLEIPSYLISSSINNYSNKNFNFYINEKRVSASKKIIQKRGSVLAIEGIGNEVGFQNRSTFYRWFKRIEKMTPGEYLSSIKAK